MKISFNTPITANRITSSDGYGYGTQQILASLKRLGHTVTENDGTADVGFVFNQPQHARYFGSQYKILYHPWESTLMPTDWPGIMNDCDEVWTPSPLIAQWYSEYNAVSRPIYVYEHGIDSIWDIKPREVKDKITFLHVGGEAYRKGLPETLKAFRAAFNGSQDVELMCKMGTPGFNLAHHGNVNTLGGKVSISDLIQLHHDRNVFVYPSWGEGFGFNPFQAMATGMPTIITGAWAPYERFIDPNLDVNSYFTESPWQTPHPGDMFKPDVDDLVDKMRYVVDNYSQCHDYAQAMAPQIHKDYDWDKLTQEAFESLENRLNK